MILRCFGLMLGLKVDCHRLSLTLGACARVMVVVLCVSVYVCVCYHATCHIPRFYVSNTVLKGWLPRFDCKCMYCMDLAENAPFRSSGVICWSPPPSSLLDELSMNKIASFQLEDYV